MLYHPRKCMRVCEYFSAFVGKLWFFLKNELENFQFSPFFEQILASTPIIQKISNFTNNSH